MRELLDNIDVKRGISPAAATTDNTPFVSQILDMQCLASAEFIIRCGALADADATFAVLAEEGENRRPSRQRFRSARPCARSASRARAAISQPSRPAATACSRPFDFTTLGLSLGKWVKIGDGDNAGHRLATAADNGFCRISAVAAHKLSFGVVPAGGRRTPALAWPCACSLAISW